MHNGAESQIWISEGEPKKDKKAEEAEKDVTCKRGNKKRQEILKRDKCSWFSDTEGPGTFICSPPTLQTCTCFLNRAMCEDKNDSSQFSQCLVKIWHFGTY